MDTFCGNQRRSILAMCTGKWNFVLKTCQSYVSSLSRILYMLCYTVLILASSSLPPILSFPSVSSCYSTNKDSSLRFIFSIHRDDNKLLFSFYYTYSKKEKDINFETTHFKFSNSKPLHCMTWKLHKVCWKMEGKGNRQVLPPPWICSPNILTEVGPEWCCWPQDMTTALPLDRTSQMMHPFAYEVRLKLPVFLSALW